MSRRNKVDKDTHTQAGRLTPDEFARERQKQGRPRASDRPIMARAERMRGRGAERGSTRPRSAPEE